MWGSDAAKIVHDLGGQTVNRQGLNTSDGLTDLHVRVYYNVLTQGHFGDLYLQALGGELSGLGREVYLEFVDRLKNELAQAQPEHPYGSRPIYGDDFMCANVMNGIRPTLFYSVIRTRHSSTLIRC